MKIDFQAIPESHLDHFYGGEKLLRAHMVAGEGARILRGTLEPGASIGLHTHDQSCEVIYILSGTGKALYDGGEEALSPGDCHYCPKGHTHSLICDGGDPLVFFAVVPNQ